jgi:hypothetical protein
VHIDNVSLLLLNHAPEEVNLVVLTKSNESIQNISFLVIAHTQWHDHAILIRLGSIVPLIVAIKVLFKDVSNHLFFNMLITSPDDWLPICP